MTVTRTAEVLLKIFDRIMTYLIVDKRLLIYIIILIGIYSKNEKIFRGRKVTKVRKGTEVLQAEMENKE